ncbi:MAG: sulfur carrier protein ThiS [Candidatus Omnitrophota bacterium]|nr:sulfur carrier protein ThiS [Candidatus Omnitrophota bacterium]
MVVKINGKEEIITEKLTLSEFVSNRGLCFDKIVIEHNSLIVAKENCEEIILEENDNLEIVSFVGGG